MSSSMNMSEHVRLINALKRLGNSFITIVYLILYCAFFCHLVQKMCPNSKKNPRTFVPCEQIRMQHSFSFVWLPAKSKVTFTIIRLQSLSGKTCKKCNFLTGFIAYQNGKLMQDKHGHELEPGLVCY